MKKISASLIVLFISLSAFAQNVDTLSFARRGLSSCVLGDKAYFTGTDLPGTDTIDIFDNTSLTWSHHVMTTRKYIPFCRVVNDKAYFISSSGLYSNVVLDHIIDYYDNTTATWGTDTVPLSVPLEIMYFDVHVHGQDLVFMNETPNANTWPPYLLTLNTQTHQWTIDIIPDTLQSSRFTINHDEVVWVSSSLNPVQYLVHYDLNTQAITLDTMPITVDNPYVFAAENKTFIHGGRIPFTAYTSHDFFIYDHPNDTFNIIQQSLGGDPQVLRYGNKIFFGGSGAYSGLYSYNVPTCLIYDTGNDQINLVNMSYARNYYGLTANCGKFYLAGGFSYNQNNPGIFRDTIDAFDTISFARTTGQLLQPTAYVTAESVGQALFFAGGQTTYNTYTPLVEYFDCQTLGEAENEHSPNAIKVYPVPANNELHFETSFAFRYTISDVAGRKLLSGNEQSGTSTIRLNEIPPGVYFIEITNETNDVNSQQIFIRQ